MTKLINQKIFAQGQVMNSNTHKVIPNIRFLIDRFLMRKFWLYQRKLNLVKKSKEGIGHILRHGGLLRDTSCRMK